MDSTGKCKHFFTPQISRPRHARGWSGSHQSTVPRHPARRRSTPLKPGADNALRVELIDGTTLRDNDAWSSYVAIGTVPPGTYAGDGRTPGKHCIALAGRRSIGVATYPPPIDDTHSQVLQRFGNLIDLYQRSIMRRRRLGKPTRFVAACWSVSRTLSRA